MNRNLYIISVGIGDFDLISVKGLNLLNKMDILIGYPQLMIYSNNKPFYGVKTVEELKSFLFDNLDKMIGLLVSGDAGFFSFAKRVYNELGDHIMEVVPAVSTFQYALSKIFETYEDLSFYSVHADNDMEGLKRLVDRKDKIFLILKDKSQLFEVYNIFNMGDYIIRFFGDLNTDNEIITDSIDEIIEKNSKKIAIYWRKNGQNSFLRGRSR
ncbi:MAG: cobalt-precorrin-7 (C(5))-methyltransferase [Calditerrivibrio sp.]|nr:cobalt-precorrin-7 (C(5))-methyltransferase [Calditerrivibrio sp.]MCA1932719.1 cobalt-precorrin-7 (C(5))-methyltransferase [Calditerrivibrio sp.]